MATHFETNNKLPGCREGGELGPWAHHDPWDGPTHTSPQSLQPILPEDGLEGPHHAALITALKTHSYFLVWQGLQMGLHLEAAEILP